MKRVQRLISGCDANKGALRQAREGVACTCLDSSLSVAVNDHFALHAQNFTARLSADDRAFRHLQFLQVLVLCHAVQQ